MSRENFGRFAWTRLARVLEHLQVDAASRAESAAIELHALASETEEFGLSSVATTARHAAQLARKWQRGDEPMAARVRLVALMREMRRELQA